MVPYTSECIFTSPHNSSVIQYLSRKRAEKKWRFIYTPKTSKSLFTFVLTLRMLAPAALGRPGITPWWWGAGYGQGRVGWGCWRAGWDCWQTANTRKSHKNLGSGSINSEVIELAKRVGSRSITNRSEFSALFESGPDWFLRDRWMEWKSK
jgi:hypothetical protein